MPDFDLIATHYTHGRLLQSILAGVAKLGKTPRSVRIDDLAPVDEFHIGGRIATESLLDQLGLRADDEILDVGCGLGGACRFVAQRYGCRVTGIDLTPQYIETGRILCSWVGLEDRITMLQGNATGMPSSDATFDKAYMLHVGMNIVAKHALAAELHRVLRPGGRLGIYDVMRVGGVGLTYPVPWASTAEGSAVGSPAEYKEALAAAGFRIIAERNRRDFALEFFARMQSAAVAAEGPPPLGLHILMGETAPTKIRNMIQNISENLIAPVELIAERVP